MCCSSCSNFSFKLLLFELAVITVALFIFLGTGYRLHKNQLRGEIKKAKTVVLDKSNITV
jgi:hypothetical protein